MLTQWDLLKDVLPADEVRQASPLAFLDEVIAGAPAGPVLCIGLPDEVRTKLTLGGRELVVAAWPSSLDPFLTADAVARRGRFPARRATFAVALVAEVLETCDDPAELLREIVRVTRPDAAIAGLASSLDASLAPRARTLPAVGLRLLLEQAGTSVKQIVPGPDAVAVAHRRRFGFADWPDPAADGFSSGNAEIKAWGEETGRRPALVHLRMLQFCGVYAWRGEPSGKGPTTWARKIASAKPKASAAAAPERIRTFALAVPSSPGIETELVIKAPESGFIARQLATTGLRGYEPDSLATMLAAADLAGEGTIYDIGANVGVFALVAGSCTTRPVVAFEPMPGLAATARAAAASNKLDLVSVEEIAMAAEAGSATFYASAVSDASNSLNAKHRAHSESFDVVLDTLDRYVPATGRIPAVVKIDTETTEPDVIRGGITVLAKHRPWIICEVLGSGRPEEIAALMAPLGYTYYRITDDHRFVPADQPAPDPAGQFYNWLFAPEPVGENFWERLDDWRGRLEKCAARAM